MIKQAPSIGRILAMVVFTLSCFGLLLFLWLAFGGPIPLNPEGYRFKVPIPEAATLAVEADVRMAGVNVGKVKTKELQKGAGRTLVELEIDAKYAPIPKNSKAVQRQKTLLGESYVEIAPGDKRTGMLADGGTLPNSQVEDTVQLDEIFNAFDEPTRKAFREWILELSKAFKKGGSQDLNDAFGNLEGLAVDGAKLLRTLDEQEVAVRRVIKNTGVVFGALNERQGQLRQLIVNSNNTFEATASRDEALAETFRIFPTFLDESKATLARLEGFSRNTSPLVRDLKGPADDLGPTVRDLGDLAPDLERLLRDLDPLIKASATGLPDLQRFVAGAEPVLAALHPFFQELNPILSFLNYHQATVAGFISNAASDLNSKPGCPSGDKTDAACGERVQTNVAVIDPRSLESMTTRPDFDRGNPYLTPNALNRVEAFGTYESFTCPGGKNIKDPDDQVNNSNPLTKDGLKRAPCFMVPPQLFDNRVYPRVERGKARKVDPPKGVEGTRPADPNQ